MDLNCERSLCYNRDLKTTLFAPKTSTYAVYTIIETVKTTAATAQHDVGQLYSLSLCISLK